MNEELEKLRELTRTLTSNGYLTDQTKAWGYAFDSVNDLVCITNMSLKVKFINKALCNKLNIECSDFINKDIDCIISKDVFALENQEHSDGLPGFCGESFIEDLDGWYEKYRFFIENKSKKVIGYTFILRDITQRKAIEEALVSSEEQYRTLFNEMQSGLALHEMIYDEQANPIDYKFINVNPAFEKLTGLKADDVIGKTICSLMPNIENYWIQTYYDVVRTKKSIHFEQYSLELDKYYSVRAFSPKPNQFACVFNDITEHRLREIELKAQGKLLYGVLNAIPDIIGIQDADHNILDYNKAGKDYFNLTSEELKGKKCYELIGRTTSCRDCQTKTCIEQKAPAKLERFIEELKGWYDCRSYPILDDNGNVIQVIEHLRNIDLLKKEQAVRETYYKKMLQTYKRLHFMISSVDGYIWEKTKCDSGLGAEMVHTFVDPDFCRDFYGLSTDEEDNFRICKMAYNKSSTELLEEFRRKDNREHSFSDICTLTDIHCESQGKPCEYFEMGYIEQMKGKPEWFILRIRKTPLYNDMGECTGILGFANNCSKDSKGIKTLIERGLITGLIKKMETGNSESRVYWVTRRKEEEKDLTHIDFP